MKVFIVSDNNCTDGECGHIIGVTLLYEVAARLKADYLKEAERRDHEHRLKYPDSIAGSRSFISFAVRYPFNIEIQEKELVE